MFANSGVASTATSFSSFPTVRKPISERNFKSPAIEKAIATFKQKVKNEELGWLFGNCFPNTLDTTVFYSEKDGRPDTYVITGDIDAMWLRDSSAQVYPYLDFMSEDKNLQKLIYNPQIQKSGETKTKGSKSGKNPEKSQFQAVIEI